MSRRTRSELTAEQQVEAQRLRGLMLEAAAAEITELAELLATKTDATMLGGEPRPSRPLWRSGKKGLPRFEPDLPHVWRVGAIPALAGEVGDAPPRFDSRRAGLLSLPPLPSRVLPAGRRVAAGPVRTESGRVVGHGSGRRAGEFR